jgi:cell wall-associated NlpC family hydrolase
VYNLRLSRRARLSIGGAVLTLTASAGAVTLQPATADATTASTAPSASTVPLDTPPMSMEFSETTSTLTPHNKAEGSSSVKTKAKKKLSKAALQRAKAERAVSAAKKQIGEPYRWGGTGPSGFDCSGLVQYSWKKAGVAIPRVTQSQYARIRTKVSYSKLQPGDLLFFRGKGHVGMYVGKGKMIHSPSSGKTVTIEKLSGWRKASFSGAVRPGM